MVESLEVPESIAGASTAMTKEFHNISVDESLLVEMKSVGDKPLATLSAIELVREE